MDRGIEFRVFVSSTFGDMVAERGLLQAEVFPRVDAHCRAHGAAFRAIDLRWGISEEAARDRRTMDICLEEVRRCHRRSPALNFIALIGSRYGWRPLPGVIEGTDFTVLLDAAAPADRRALARAYRRDDNALPARFVLLPQPPRASAKSLLAAEESLRAVLDRILGCAWPATDRRRLRYAASATHLEIDERFALDAGTSTETTGSLFYLREPRRAREIAPADRAALAALRAQVEARLGARGRHRYEADGLSRWKTRVERDLMERVRGALRTAADAAPPDPEQAHERYGRGLAAGARGQRALLARLRRYLEAPRGHPLVVTGISGSGKSTLLARAWTELQGKRSESGAPVFARFVGCTSASRDLEGMLRGLCAGIDRVAGVDAALPSGVDALAKALRQRLAASPERPMILVVDALDQLEAQSPRARIAWLPRELPGHVHVLASVLEDPGPAGDTLRTLRAMLPREAFVPMRPLAESDARPLLGDWLSAGGRRLQPAQTRIVLAAASRSPTPLYLRLAAIEASGWRSYDRPEKLPAGTEALLARRFARLARPAEHGATIVRSALALLGAARRGLSESEMLPLLSGDADVMAELARRSPHWPLDATLPFVVWARLRADLAPYLTERREDDSEVMAFFHGAVQRAAERAGWADGRETQAHAALARFFGGGWGNVPQPHRFVPARPDPPRPNLRKLAELPYQQTHARAWSEVCATLGDLLFVRAKCAAGRTGDLVADYERALEALGSDRQGDHAEALRALGEWQGFVVRERAAFEAHAAVDGFVLQQALNAGGAIARAWRGLPRRDRNQWALHVEEGSRSALPLATLEGHAKGVTDCGFDASGSWLMTSGMDGKVLAWRTRGWGLEDVVGDLPDSADSVAVQADGRRVASACADGHIRVHDLARGTTVVCEGRYERGPRRCRFVNGDRAVLSVGYRGMRLHDARTGRLLRRALDDAILNDCTPGPGGLVTLGDCEGGVLVFDLKAWKLRHHFYLDDVVRVQGSALSADGSRLLATGGRFSPDDDRKPFGATAIWRLGGGGEGGKEEVEIERHGWPALNCLFVDGERAIVVGLQDGTLCVHRSSDGELIQRVRAHDNGVRGLALSPDHALLVSAAFDGKVRVWSVASLRSGDGEDAGESRRGLFCAVDPTGRKGWALTATIDNHRARVRMQEFGRRRASREIPRSRRLDELPVWRRDPSMPQQVFEVGVDGFDVRAAHAGAPLSGDGVYALVHASARHWPSAFHLLPELKPERWSADNVTWARSIDGRQTALLRSAMAREDGALRRRFELLWFADDASDEPYRRFELTGALEAAGAVCQFSLRPHFVFLAIGPEVRELGIDGRMRVVARAEAEVSACVESADGSMLLVGAGDGSVSVWKLEDGARLRRVAAHRGEVVDVVFLDDRRFVSAGADGTVRLWRLRDTACEAVYVADAALVAVDAAGAARRVIAVDAQGSVYWMRVVR